MAIVAMLLLTLTFGTADMGLFMYKYVQAANCTREAARRAAVRKDPTNIPYCVDASLRPTVTYADPGKSAGTDVTATINTTYSWIVIGYLVPGLGNTINLKSATTMRLEGAKDMNVRQQVSGWSSLWHPSTRQADRRFASLRENTGQALVMVGLMMMVLIGFAALATDTGFIWMNRRSLQNSVDAAALAGVQHLPNDTGTATAKGCEYATIKNAVSGMVGKLGTCSSKADIQIKQTYVANDTIVATAYKTINPIFGIAVGFAERGDQRHCYRSRGQSRVQLSVSYLPNARNAAWRQPGQHEFLHADRNAPCRRR